MTGMSTVCPLLLNCDYTFKPAFQLTVDDTCQSSRHGSSNMHVERHPVANGSFALHFEGRKPERATWGNFRDSKWNADLGRHQSPPRGPGQTNASSGFYRGGERETRFIHRSGCSRSRLARGGGLPSAAAYSL